MSKAKTAAGTIMLGIDRARQTYGDDCHTQVVDGVLQARPQHGLTWIDVVRVGGSGGDQPTYVGEGQDIRRLLISLGIDPDES